VEHNWLAYIQDFNYVLTFEMTKKLWGKETLCCKQRSESSRHHLCECTVQRAETGSRVWVLVHTVSITRDCKYGNQLPLENSNLLSIFVATGWVGSRWCCWWVRISSRVRYDTETIQMFRSANIGRLNLFRKRPTKCETVAKSLDTQLAKLWSKDHVQFSFRESVASCGRWQSSQVFTVLLDAM
jgi:hypothetical protein